MPGNHDEAARHYLGLAFGDIAIQEEAIHTTVHGKRLLVIHGDLFDGVVQYTPWLASLIDVFYSFILKLNRHVNGMRARLGLPYWSLAKFVNHKVKNAVNYIVAFEEALAQEARHRGFDGVVCGHIHKAEIREIDGTLYCNDGDWVESLTALVEMTTGEMRVLHWHDMREATSKWSDVAHSAAEEQRRRGGDGQTKKGKMQHANPDRNRCLGASSQWCRYDNYKYRARTGKARPRSAIGHERRLSYDASAKLSGDSPRHRAGIARVPDGRQIRARRRTHRD